MKKVYISLFFTIIIANTIIFHSCSTIGINNMNIASIEVLLYKRVNSASVTSFIPVDTIKPGEQCKLQVVIYTQEGQRIENPNLNDFVISSPNRSFLYLERYFDNTILLTANPDSFHFSDGKRLELKLGIINNPYKDKKIEWEVDWQNYTTFNYAGKDGITNEVNPVLASLFPGGADGLDGKAGEDGFFCNFDLAYYAVTGEKNEQNTKMVILYDRINKKVYFTRPAPYLLLITNGGRGSDGTDGLPRKNGKPAGNGGNGGTGGDGGDIIINLHENSDIMDYVKTQQAGGAGGAGGQGGRDPAGKERAESGRTSRDGFSGEDGLNGQDGRAGKLKFVRFSSFDNLFQDLKHPLFKRSKLSD
jgi:hypothetical protein